MYIIRHKVTGAVFGGWSIFDDPKWRPIDHNDQIEIIVYTRHGAAIADAKLIGWDAVIAPIKEQ